MVEAQPDEFSFLQRLARDKTAAGRRILTSTISDLFFDQRNVLSDREHALMTEILRKLRLFSRNKAVIEIGKIRGL